MSFTTTPPTSACVSDDAVFADMCVGMTWGVEGDEFGADDATDSTAPLGLSPRAAVEALKAVERQLAQLHALQVRLLVAAADVRPHIAEYSVLLPGDDPWQEEERVIRIEDSVREEIAAALRWSPVTAQYRIDHARLLAGPLAPTAAALAEGTITPAHARVVVENAERLPGRWMRDEVETAQFTQACTVLQQRVLPVAARGTLSRTRTAATRAVIALDPVGAGRRRQVAQRTCDVSVSDDVDGISTLIARLATEKAHAILRRIVAHAEALPPAGGQATASIPPGGPASDSTPASAPLIDEERETIGQRRARAFIDLMLSDPACESSSESTRAPRTGAARRMSAHVDVVVDLPTLLALRDTLDATADATAATATAATTTSATTTSATTTSASTTSASTTSATTTSATTTAAHQMSAEQITAEHVALLAHRVAVAPAVLRDLLADPDVSLTLRRLVTEPLTGALLDLGRSTYAIPDRLRDFLVARDRTCRFPGCRQPAQRCQVDHIVPWDDDGTTSPDNLHLLCPRHHQLKTHGGWEPTRHPDGSTTWISPQGRVFVVPPEPTAPGSG